MVFWTNPFLVKSPVRNTSTNSESYIIHTGNVEYWFGGLGCTWNISTSMVTKIWDTSSSGECYACLRSQFCSLCNSVNTEGLQFSILAWMTVCIPWTILNVEKCDCSYRSHLLLLTFVTYVCTHELGVLLPFWLLQKIFTSAFISERKCIFCLKRWYFKNSNLS